MTPLCDLTGQRFGKLVVTKRDETRGGVKCYWWCVCDCGTEKSVRGTHLSSGNTKSCGCLRNIREDLTGKKFYFLTVVERAYVPGEKRTMWSCKCDCGNENVIVCTGGLKNGNNKSCGCINKNKAERGFTVGKGEANFNKLFKRYARQAKNRNKSFELDKDTFRKLTKSNCFYCGCEPSNVIDDKPCYGEYIYTGIDRIDSSKGYTLDNVVPCCGRCNYAKLDAPQQDFLLWIDRVYAHIHRNDIS